MQYPGRAILLIAFAALIVALGGLPGKIARQREHPQADAVSALGWISLFTAGVLWPVAFTWAFLRPSQSTAGSEEANKSQASAERLVRLETRLQALEARLAQLEKNEEK